MDQETPPLPHASAVCRRCGASFDRPHRRGRPASFCSDKCRRDQRLADHQTYNAARALRRRAFGMCLDCREGQEQLAVPHTDFCPHHAARRAASDARKILARYGLTSEEFAALYECQSGKCAICGITETEAGRRHAVDHDHACCPGETSCGKCVRGFLCSGCNTGLGLFQDRADVLAAAAAYLSRSVQP